MAKISPHYIQVDCEESKELDLSQAKAVQAHHPDIIFLEYPIDYNPLYQQLNEYSPPAKPPPLVKELLKPLPKRVLAIHPWAQADHYLWENVAELWRNNHQVLIYPVDAPSELTSEWLEVWNHMYPQAKKNWVWWVQIYLRERLMANNVQAILDRYDTKSDPTILVFLQSFHWQHAKFLLKNPPTHQIWQYYFGKFSNEISQDIIAEKIEALNPVFCKYWSQYSDFT